MSAKQVSVPDSRLKKQALPRTSDCFQLRFRRALHGRPRQLFSKSGFEHKLIERRRQAVRIVRLDYKTGNYKPTSLVDFRWIGTANLCLMLSVVAL